MLSVRTQLLIAFGLMFALSFAAFLLWIEHKEEAMLQQTEQLRARQLVGTLSASLKAIMLAGRGDVAHEWLDRVRASAGVRDAVVMRKNGKPAFADDETIRKVNAWLNEARFAPRGKPLPVPRLASEVDSALLAKAVQGEVVQQRRGKDLIVYAPIRREEACLRCHGYDPHPVRGVLVLRLAPEATVAGLGEIQTSYRLILALFLFFALMVGYFVAEGIVLRPLARMANAARRIAAGQSKIARLAGVERADEFGELARAFNALLARIEQRWQKERLLRELVIDLAASESLDEIMNRIGETARLLLEAPYVMVSWKQEGRPVFRPFGVDVDALLARGLSWPKGLGLLGRLWDTGEMLRLADIRSHPDAIGLPEGHPAIGAFLGAGIRTRDEVTGVIYLGRPPNEPAFTEEDERMLRALTAAASVAIDRARRLQELRALNEELEARVAERTEELARKNEALRRREMELEAVNQELEEAMRMKDEFISTASHELRTPLNAVVGFAELLAHPRYGELSPKQKEFLDRITTAGRRLVAIINDMLDISRIESGRMTVRESPFEIAKLAAELEGELASLAAEKNIAYRVQAQSAAVVVSDEAKIHQILVNLLGNALKFTPEGGKVEGILRVENGELVAEVRDTGIGIPEKDLERIFRPFEQVETGATRQYKGTGLGLALSRKLAELLGGSLTARSKVGQGSTFVLRVPVQVQKAEASTTKEERKAKPAPILPVATDAPCVLLVDEDAERARHVRAMLEREGYHVEATSLEKAPERAHAVFPFVILLGDPGDPKRLSQMVAALKRDEAVAEIPLVLVGGTPEEPRFVPGAIEFTGEALDTQRLLDRISCYGRLLAPLRKQPTVLVVDDDEATRSMLTETLTSAGWRVVAASSSHEAQRLAKEIEPNVIVLDLMLPDASGFDLLEQLAADPATADIPVVIHTGRALGAGDLARLGAAAEHVVVKGSGGLDLVNHLRKVELAYPTRARLIDPMLDVRNHRYLRLRLAQEARLTRRHDYPIALVGWEMNEVEAYVQRHGQRWASVMLREMCELVRGRLRASDEIARIGFARFVAILPHVDRSGARMVAEKLRLRIMHARWTLPGGAFGQSTASFATLVLSGNWSAKQAEQQLMAAIDEAAKTPNAVLEWAWQDATSTNEGGER